LGKWGRKYPQLINWEEGLEELPPIKPQVPSCPIMEEFGRPIQNKNFLN